MNLFVKGIITTINQINHGGKATMTWSQSDHHGKAVTCGRSLDDVHWKFQDMFKGRLSQAIPIKAASLCKRKFASITRVHK
jgi:hypothetical protein